MLQRGSNINKEHEQGIASGMVLECEAISRDKVKESLVRGIGCCARETFFFSIYNRESLKTSCKEVTLVDLVVDRLFWPHCRSHI